jgi:hypothetical protein
VASFLLRLTTEGVDSNGSRRVYYIQTLNNLNLCSDF